MTPANVMKQESAQKSVENYTPPVAVTVPRICLVTGGTGGIGSVICQRLAKAGHVVATTYRNEEKAKAWKIEMAKQGYTFHIYKCDVASFEDTGKCIKCNLCYVACNDTAHQCIDLVDAAGHIVPPFAYDVRSNGKEEATSTRPQTRVREEDCVGCRLCYNVCPVDHCISMVEVPSGREPVTWSQIMQSEPTVTEDWAAMEEYRRKVGIDIH